MRNREVAQKKAHELVARMTIEEKISQLRHDASAIERLGIPAYNWWNEGLHGVARAGVATSFPQAIALAATFDCRLVSQIAGAIALEGRAKYNASVRSGDRDIYKGLTFFSPNINIFRDPRWGRGHETYGEDPYLTGELGKAFVTGLQGDGETLKAGACAKHFAVHSGPEALRHQFNATCSKKDLWETYLPAFEALVCEAKVESVMGAYNRFDGEPCCASEQLLTDVLRKKWKFQGYVVSDYGAVVDFHKGHRKTESPEQSAAFALNNGCDLNCGWTYRHLLSAYHQKLVTKEQITLAAERIFTTRYLLGILGGGSEYDDVSYETIECREHLALSREAALKSCVLLKNDGILPLNRSKLHTLGVIGPNANSRIALTGNYHGTSSRYVTVLEGLQNACDENIRVLYAPGCAMTEVKTEPLAQDDDRIAEAVTVAEHSDTVVLVLGLDELLEGEAPDDGNSMEAGDKADLMLPAVQQKLMERVLAVGKPTVVVLLAGSAIDLKIAQDNANGVLLAWYPGARAGDAVADLLFGIASPSGKLPVTFYYNSDLDALPSFSDYSIRGRTYRYLASAPLYPFGYGLTYGDVQITNAEVKAASKSDGITLEVTIENFGGVATDDVIQLYIKAEDSSFAPKNPILCGFRRVHVLAGQRVSMELYIDARSFLVVDDEGNRIDGGNRYMLYAGVSQPDARSWELTGAKPVCIEIKM